MIIKYYCIERGNNNADVSVCDRVYDESEYCRCPYCSGELENERGERYFKICPDCDEVMYWDDTWMCLNWEIIVRDENGAMVNIDYVCPHCGYSTGELISIGASGVDCLDSSWETDQECGICGEPVIVVCH